MIKWIISSSCLILIMIVLRKLFRGKISPRLQYALWLLVAVRLFVPVNFGSSALSIENFTNTLINYEVNEEVSESPVILEEPELSENEDRVKIYDSIESIQANESVKLHAEQEEVLSTKNGVTVKTSAEITASQVLLIFWVLGAIITAFVFVISNIVFGKRMKSSRILLEDQNEKLPVYVLRVVETPCLFGIFHPAIYVTNVVAAEENTLRHAVVHELTHYEQGDIWWSLLRCVCITLHWYNPLVWWAAKLSKQDAELACDEATIKKLGEEERLAYGKTLIRLTCEKKQDWFVAATTMTSDKKSIKERIQQIANKRKLTIYALAGVLLISVIAVGCTFTGAENSKEPESNETAMVRGIPCENPEAAGWNLGGIEDVRENFYRMSPEPEEGSENAVYLLAETSDHEYQLYGKGDYQTMLVEMDGKYAEIDFAYASNYMELPRLIEQDIDNDGKMELCIIVWLQHGTGLHIENFLLADFNEEEQLYVYEFVTESYTEQLQKVLSCEITEEGIQPLVNGQLAGKLEPHMEDIGPFDGVSVGNQMRFECDPLTGEVRLRGQIMLLHKEHPGALWNNGNDVTAKVCWDGEKFTLTNFTSNPLQTEGENALDVPSKAELIISKADVNLREGYQEAKLTYVDNAEVGWDYYFDNPWSTEEERDALAQAALKELYNLTGYNVTECTYTTDGRSKFIFGKSGEYIKKCIAFYTRDYGFTLSGDEVPYQGYVNARRVHYSDVQQLSSPYENENWDGEGGLSRWYLEHSGVYQGEDIIEHEEINQDDTVYIHVKMKFDGGYYIVVIDKELESCQQVMGPYYEEVENSETEIAETDKQTVITNQSYENVIQDEVYRQTMTEFLETGVFPASVGVQCNGNPWSALYAVQDVDGDGREELLLNFLNADSVAGMTYYIYDYDRTTGKIYSQISGYPDFTIYDNGYIKVEMSHNHGRSNLDDFWPYFLYYYNPEVDFYEYITSVDAWQKKEDIEENPPFPKEKDLNGDGVVYYHDMAQTYDNPETILDNEEYEKWCEKYNQGDVVEIQWYLAENVVRLDEIAIE